MDQPTSTLLSHFKCVYVNEKRDVVLTTCAITICTRMNVESVLVLVFMALFQGLILRRDGETQTQLRGPAAS